MSTPLGKDLQQRANFALWLLLSFFLILYGLTLRKFHSYDALYYVQIIDQPDLRKLIHPHHIAPHLLMTGWDRLWRLLGYQGDYFLPAQFLSLFCTLIGINFFFRFLVRVTRHITLSSLVALNLGCSYGLWFIATEIEVYAYTFAALMIGMELISKWNQSFRIRDSFIASLMLGVAGTCHQTAFLFTLGFGAMILFHPALDLKNKSKHLTSEFLGVFLGGIVPYILAAFVLSIPLANLFDWMMSYAHNLPGFGKTFRMHLAFYGFHESFFGTLITDWIRETKHFNWLDLIPLLLPGLTLLFIALYFLSRIFFIRQLFSKSEFTLIFSNFVIFTVFWSLWDPLTFEAYQAVLPYFWCLLAIGATAKNENLIKSQMLLLASFLLLLSVNLTGTVSKHLSIHQDPAYPIAETFADISNPDDLLLIPSGNQEHYLSYFFKRPHYWTLHDLAIKYPPSQDAFFPEMRRMIDSYLSRGRNIYLAEEVLQPSSGILNLHRLGQEQLNQFWSHYQPRLKRVATYQGLSHHRVMGLRSGMTDFAIYQISSETPA